MTDAGASASHPNCQLIDARLAAAGVPGRVQILPSAAPTAIAAAEQIGCPVAAIANSLIFADSAGQPVLILTSGAHRVDTAKVAALIGTAALKRASPDFVRQHTNQVIGGVAPIGHPQPIQTILDVDLAAFDPIWAAGGIAHAVFPISYEQLRALTGARELSVA
jgi:prolyl-tRNA editing enzyme YbaK/EbsC (Cys-tRNA(Pro) deacylase)